MEKLKLYIYIWIFTPATETLFLHCFNGSGQLIRDPEAELILGLTLYC